MPSLFEQQSGFISALFNQAEDARAFLLATQGSNVPAGLAIYRNNVFSNYRRVLSAVYPVIQRLVGDDFFTAVSDAYIHAKPSNSGDVRDYGKAFSDFLSSYPAALDLVYLPDVARIEWACHQVLNGSESPMLQVARLSEVTTGQLGQSHIELCAASELIASPYPVVKIWQTNQADFLGDDHVDLSAGAEYGLVLRQQFIVTLHPLSASEFEFLTQLNQQKPLSLAVQSAQAISADFDLGECLMRHISNGAISEIHFKGGGDE